MIDTRDNLFGIRLNKSSFGTKKLETVPPSKIPTRSRNTPFYTLLNFFSKSRRYVDNRPGSPPGRVYPLTRKITRRP